MSFEAIQVRARTAWEDFSRTARPRILVGSATCGRAAGALEVIDAFGEELKRQALEDRVRLVEVGCNGLCFAECLVEVTGCDGRRVLYYGVTPELVPELVESHVVNGKPVVRRALAVVEGRHLDGVRPFSELPVIRNQVRIVLRNCGFVDPTDLSHYVARGGFEGLTRALDMKYEEVIDEIDASGLRGRGGAGFPTGRKWRLARASRSDEKYVICNADEGDPGAFMDRAVLESDPHAVLEGLMIAGYAIGAARGIVYVRAEYPLAVERVRQAIAGMRENGLLGDRILGSGFGFDIRIKKGAGAFVCGEETALIGSIEGRRGMPVARPPYPARSGLHGRPTNINNVETLASVSAILEKGASWFSQYGTETSKGTKTFALAGKVRNTGLIEVPMGITLRTIIHKIGGGMSDGRTIKAVQTGGPSGGCISSEHLDLPVDYEHLAQVGSIIGSGGMVAMDDRSCMVDVAKYFLGFTESESCGKCIPCRMGTRHLLRTLTDICEGRGRPQDVDTLRKISEVMAKTSLCGLGQTAPSPVLTTLDHFEHEYKAHIDLKTCPAGVCRELISFEVNEDRCTCCTLCKRACPVHAISGEKGETRRIDQQACIRCGSCRDECRFDAIMIQPRAMQEQVAVE